MRFQVSQVMDAIEQRLTTDTTGAQAVADLGRIIRYVELDGGRPVNLVRIGMVMDALSRYLVDGGAMLYGVVERSLLSEGALTSKERMVLSRWADQGLIEVTAAIDDRVAEVGDLTGLPLIALAPEPELVPRYRWLAEGTGRVLRLDRRGGVAVLTPMDGRAAGPPAAAPQPAVGRAGVPRRQETEPAEDEPAEAAAEQPDPGEPAEPAAGAADTLPLPVVAFGRGAAVARTVISRHRFLRGEPNPAHAALLRRQWRCDEFECPAFGEHRQGGQPALRVRSGVATCPRHDRPVVDIGPRRPAYALSIVVDDLPRRRLVVWHGQPLSVGRATPDPADPDPALVSVASWLHRAATAWISPVHLRLEATEQGLVVTDLSENGSVVWQRKGPEGPAATKLLCRESHMLGEWDSVELYTGIELARGDRRPAAALGRDEPLSVLVDAPTAAHHQVAS